MFNPSKHLLLEGRTPYLYYNNLYPSLPSNSDLKDYWAQGRYSIGKVLIELIWMKNILARQQLDFHFTLKKLFPKGMASTAIGQESCLSQEGLVFCQSGTCSVCSVEKVWHKYMTYTKKSDTRKRLRLLSPLCYQSSWLKSLTIPEAAVDKSSLGFQSAVCFSSETQKEGFLQEKTPKKQGFSSHMGALFTLSKGTLP